MEGREVFYVYLWDEAHECCTNRDNKEVAYCQIDKQMSEKNGITRDYYKSKWKILRSQLLSSGTKKKLFQDFFGSRFIVMRIWDSLFSNQCLPKLRWPYYSKKTAQIEKPKIWERNQLCPF